MAKILYYHQYFSTPEGKASIRSYKFAKKLQSEGHEVTVVCAQYASTITGLEKMPFSNGVRTGNVEGLNIIEFEMSLSNSDSLPKRALVFISFAIKTALLALKLDFDILFATSTPLTVAIPGIVMKLFRKKKFIFEVRDLWPELPREMGVIKNPIILFLMGALERMAYKSADSLIGLSPGIVKGIEKHNRGKKDVYLIPNGCDHNVFSPTTKDHQENKLRAIFAGTHGMANGLDAVLDAAAELKRLSRSDIEIILIGEGKLKPGLRARAAKEGLSNIRFMDPVPKQELAQLISTCDVGLMVLANVEAFYYGTSPNKFFDYISSGLAVLNNYPGWLTDMISAHKCGLSVTPNDPKAFAKALTTFADNKGKCQEMGKNAHTLSLEFSREILASKFAGVINKTLSSTTTLKAVL